MSYHLVTTPLEETWETNLPRLFLGSWCLDPARKQVWQAADFTIAPYHWDSLEKLAEDEIYCKALYERLLGACAIAFNQAHDINWSDRAWRLMIGSWLRRFITIFYDRYQNIHTSLKAYSIDSVFCSSNTYCDLTPFDRDDFSEKYKSDRWNYLCFSKIIRETTDLPFVEMDIALSDRPVKSSPSAVNQPQIEYSPLKRIKQFLGNIYRSGFFRKLESVFTRNNRFFVYITYFPRKIDDLKLSMKLGDFPSISFIPDTSPSRGIDREARQQFHLEFSAESEFETFLVKMLPELIPVIYLESFSEMKKKAASYAFPLNPEVIYTTIGIYSNETFKYWAAEKIQEGTKLAVGQHGGHYATFKITSEGMPHELATADAYLSWGWQLPDFNVRPVPAFMLVNREKAKWDEEGHILILARYLYKYCYIHSTGSLPGRKGAEYLNLLEDLLTSIPEREKQNTILRLHPGEGDELEREVPIGPGLREKFQGMEIGATEYPLETLFQGAKLTILTYDGTPFLQSMGLDRPCILISYPERDPFSELAQPFYEELELAGIYHRTVESAVNHVNNVSGNIGQWWNGEEVRQAREKYCDTFVRTSEQPLKDISDVLKSLESS